MTAPVLRTIAADLFKLAEEIAQPDYVVDPFMLRILARRVDCQAEMIEREIAE